MVMMEKLQLTLNTGRTLAQGVGKEKGKISKDYFNSASICFMDPEDMNKAGIMNNTNVRVTSEYGSVIVKCKKNPRGSMVGQLFMPCGTWANVVCGDVTYHIGSPLYKGFPVEVEPAADEQVLQLKELLLKEYGRAE
jgi:formylmethanofuran dehydrogenase subunit D